MKQSTHVLVKVSPSDFRHPDADAATVLVRLQLAARDLHRRAKALSRRDHSRCKVRTDFVYKLAQFRT